MYYSRESWIFLFFAYSLAGYIWEVVWVSLNQKKLQNRGFLFGPWLPIYGFGAIIVLHATLPVYDNLVAVYILGLVSATALEFVTGFIMLKLFKVRYWDYSKDVGNIKGYVCPRASLAWGMFSILLIKYIHPFFDDLLKYIPDQYATNLAGLLVVVFIADVIISAENALNFKATLEALLVDENNNGIPDILEEIPVHIRQRRQIAHAKIEKLITKHPTAVFDKRVESLVERLRSK